MQEMRGAGQGGVSSRASRKARGAFFTPPEIADYLVGWAVRSAGDTVFEPSCGEAAFLLAAARRLEALGARPARWSERLHGVEIFEASARTAGTRLRGAGFDARVSVGDFFAHKPPGDPPALWLRFGRDMQRLTPYIVFHCRWTTLYVVLLAKPPAGAHIMPYTVAARMSLPSGTASTEHGAGGGEAWSRRCTPAAILRGS